MNGSDCAMEDINNADFDDDLTDEEFDDLESRARYPWLYDEEANDRKEMEAVYRARTAKRNLNKDFDKLMARGYVEANFTGPNGVNYHDMFTLEDEHLPDLAFLRYENLFLARTASGYLDAPIPSVLGKRLFGDLWRTGELVLLFADTGLGKSALAVQIASSLAGGEPIDPFEVEAEPQRVLYFDFELTDGQFAARYSDGAASDLDEPEERQPLFPLNFIRCAPREIVGIPDQFENLHDFIIHSIVDTTEFVGAKIVILDNLTWLSAATQNPVVAQRVMRTLLALKKQYDLSILVIAHTPKMRTRTPLDLNHLQGSKMLANLADNVVAMGRSSTSASLRYLKPIKLRNSQASFEENIVSVMRLGREGRMLKFTFVDHEPESRHLEGPLSNAALNEKLRRERIIRAVEMSNAGDTVREIATKLGVGVTTIIRDLEIGRVQDVSE